MLAPLYVLVIVTDVAAATVFVVTVNVAVVAFAGTVTDAGTVAALVLLLASVTATPPVGAGPVRVTVPVLLVPPVTDEGLTVTEDRAVGLTVSVADLIVPL